MNCGFVAEVGACAERREGSADAFRAEKNHRQAGPCIGRSDLDLGKNDDRSGSACRAERSVKTPSAGFSDQIFINKYK
jgi:hypothetical protein